MKNSIYTLLQASNFACNAHARSTMADFITEAFGLPEPHKLNLEEWAPVIEYAIEVSGAKHGTEYQYRNAQGSTSTAKVIDLYAIPDTLVNPFLICFSGYMPAALYTLEAYRAYMAKYGKELSLFATGQGGNKGSNPVGITNTYIALLGALFCYIYQAFRRVRMLYF